jgi:hypothetical protein
MNNRKEDILIMIERIENVNKEVQVMINTFPGAIKSSGADYYIDLMKESNDKELLRLKKMLAEIEKDEE